MVNVLKVTREIKEDGKYDALLDKVKRKLNSEDPSFDAIKKLVESDPYYIKEYKDLNRWGELTSVHLIEHRIKNDDSDAIKAIKKEINENAIYLKNAEEYEVKQKNVIYLAWTGFVALPSIYVIDNLVRITDLYEENEYSVYISFCIVFIASVWAYLKVTVNHKKQHEKYIQIQQRTRELVRVGLEKNYFTSKEAYED